MNSARLQEEKASESPPTNDVGLWYASTKLARNRLVGDYSREVGQHPATALAPPLGRITPYAWMWQLGSERIVGKQEVIRANWYGNLSVGAKSPFHNLAVTGPRSDEHQQTVVNNFQQIPRRARI